MIRARLTFLAIVSVTACGDDLAVSEDAPLVIEEGCQPLLARTTPDEASRGTCFLPYPSDFYRDPATGRIAATGKAKLRSVNDKPADIHDVVASNGYSLIPTIVATLPSAIVAEGLPTVIDDPAMSARAESTTVILDAETGAFIPHYTDKIDGGVDEQHEALVLRAFAPLLPKRRYIVALKGVRLREGGLAPPPEGFRRLRDNVADRGLERSRERFDRDIFGPIERAGIVRRDLQLAWDFTTGDAEAPRTDMMKVRELTLAWLLANPPAITITSSGPGSDRVWRTVQGTIVAPLFLDQAGPGGRLFRGPDGQVAQNGTTTFPFSVNVPNAVRDRFEPGRALAIGHGFFGGRDEMEGNPSKTIAEKLAAVQFGIDWWGMAKEDLGRVANTLGEDPAHGGDFAERVHQAMANWLVMTTAIKGPLAKMPEFARPASGEGVVVGPGGKSNAGEPVYDPSFLGFFGASQGHILGGTLAALDPNLSRVVLNVGGGGFTHIMPRSANFGPFSIVLDFTFKDDLLSQAFIAQFQRALDRIDPVTYAPLVVTPERRVLLQIGLGDASIPTVASVLHARALGVKLTVPSPQNAFGLEAFTGPNDSALTIFDYHVDTSGAVRPAPLAQNEVHNVVRTNPGALRQMDEFLRPNGTTIHPCDGACDPE